ncbi:MAG: rhodanese-like domain-containing protein [Acidimicrobiia bacterium]
MRHLRVLLPLLVLVGLVAAGCGADNEARDFTRVDADGFAAAIDADAAGVVIDLRTSEEIAVGYIEGASQLDFYESSFESVLEGLDRDTHYLVYCNSGNRSAETLRLMKDLGFTQVTELDGGIQAWNAAGLPTVRP